MEVKKNDKSLYSHTYIENDYETQLFEKVLYAIKNRRRRLILEAFDEFETMSIVGVRKYLQKKDFAGKTGSCTIKNSYLKPWVEVGALERNDRKLYRITFLGKEIRKVIKSHKKLELLKRPGHQSLSTELTLLELREGKKKYQGLMAKLNLSDPWKIVKKLKDEGLLKVNHPKNLIYTSHLFHFSVSPYYYFIEGIKDCIEKTNRSEFTVFWVIQHLNLKWRAIFKRSIGLDETQELLEKGIETGSVMKTNGRYKVSIESLTASIKALTSSEKKILDLLKEGRASASTISEKSGLHFASTHKILKKLEEKNLVEKYTESVTIELTKEGRKLADPLFMIKECLAKEFG